MKRSDIIRAYDHIQPDRESKDRMLENILSAASERTPGGKETNMKRTNLRKTWLIAAVIGLMVFLMGCAVVLFTLQDMKIGEYTYTQSRYIDENGEKIPEKEITKDVISLQGIKGSLSQQAAQEWHEFEQSYDTDYTLLNEADKNPIEVSRDYDAYFVYTQEMVDKVDEIAAKYGLELAGPIAGTMDYETDIFFDSLGLINLHREEAAIEVEYSSGYFYACGNFKSNFYITLTDEEAAWEHEILAEMRYCGKGYLDTVFAHISGVENYEQWTYKLSDGREVLIVTGDDHAIILCDTEEAFISVLFQTTYCDENNVITYMSNRDVELVADAMDFSVVPQKPDMEEAQRRIDESYAKWKAEEEARAAAYEDPFTPKASYAEKIQVVLDNGVDPDSFYYALYDVNGDGFEDLFLGSETDNFGSIYTMHNGETYMLLSFGMDRYSYLCENGVVMHNDPMGSPDNYFFYKIGEVTGDGMDSEFIDAVCYDEWEETWMRSVNGYYGSKEQITEAEAMEIIESYGRVELEMKPISEFPMN